MGDLLEVNSALYARKVAEDWGDSGQFANALYMNPTMPIYNEDGSFYHPTSPTGARNPVEQLISDQNAGDRVYLLGNFEAKLNLIKTSKHNLNTAISYSQHYNDLKQHYFTPLLPQSPNKKTMPDGPISNIRNGGQHRLSGLPTIHSLQTIIL
ncbi:MAG: hypothetical protein LUE93_06245 [Bacteroides sp.]|nr:hypothetical protein [Bacteroides sp.]